MITLRARLLFLPAHVKEMSTAVNFITDKCYINGEWVKGENGTFDVINPSDGKVLGRSSNCGEKDTEQAIKSAVEAFKEWSMTTAKYRSAILRKMFDLHIKYQKDLARLISNEMGKPLAESMGEIVYGASFLDWFSEEARRINGQVLQSAASDKMIMYTKEPAGPAAIIVPWNFPNAMITRKLGAVLAAGCTCVIRPSEETPFSALAIAKIGEEAGLPAGVLNVLTSDRSAAPVIGQLLAQSSDISVLTFTGSTLVGKQLLQWGASSVKRISLELGGNAPFIVFDSADPERAAEGCIASKFRNSGQTCVCANRIFVQKNILDEFVTKLALAMKKHLKVGPSTAPGTTIGPLVNGRAVEKVRSHVEDAVKKGAKLLVGGKTIDGNFFESTLLTDVNDEMKMCQEETFGPVAGIIPFQSEEEVLQRANSVNTGLAGYFFSRDQQQIWRVARRLQVGMVGINEGIISCPEAPFGGVKQSGLGREGSSLGIDEFVNVKYLCMGGLKF